MLLAKQEPIVKTLSSLLIENDGSKRGWHTGSRRLIDARWGQINSGFLLAREPRLQMGSVSIGIVFPRNRHMTDT